MWPRSHEWPEMPGDAFKTLPPETPVRRELAAGKVDTRTDRRVHDAITEWAMENKGVGPVQANIKAGSVVVWAGGTW